MSGGRAAVKRHLGRLLVLRKKVMG